MDGVFDLFHRGHLESLLKAKNIYPEDTTLIVGVVSDKDCEAYKRLPIIKEGDRAEIIKNIKCVDEVIFPCPLIVTMDFIKQHKIDLVVHGFCNDADRAKQKAYFENIKSHFKEIDYYSSISTTNIIKTIVDRHADLI
jgi:cytidyltransferase-like protein